MEPLNCYDCDGCYGEGHSRTCKYYRKKPPPTYCCPECGVEEDMMDKCGCAELDKDPINSPEHYNYGKTETIDYIMQVATLYPGHQAVLVGNVIKYISRAPMKGDKEKDLKKAQWYLNKLLESL